MPIPVTVVISAVTALLRYRGRVDTILSLNEVTQALPFRLPPAPRVTDRTKFFSHMWAFFDSTKGQAILAAQGLTEAFTAIQDAVRSDRDPPAPQLDLCYHLYFEAADIAADLLAPTGANDEALRQIASSGPTVDMRLAYYVVESHRLSRNPLFARLALATVDTALEYFGENASTYIANPKTRAVVESVLTEFALKQDFDDFSIAQIYQSLLGAALFAVLDNPDVVPNAPALKALFGALSDLRIELSHQAGDAEQEKADEFFARLITADSFKDLLSGVLRHVAKDPSFITSDEDAKRVVKTTLNEFADHFAAILDGDKKAVFGVIAAAIAAGADSVEGMLKKELGGKPLITAIAAAVATEIGNQAAVNAFFKGIAHGEIFADVYRVVLGAVAANPNALAQETGLAPFARELVAGLAATLTATPLQDTFKGVTFRALASKSLTLLAQYPHLVAKHNQFATQVVAAAFEAAGAVVKDGLQEEDVVAITDAALRAATDNLALVDMGDQFRAVLVSIGDALGRDGVKALLMSAGRKDALVAAVQAVAANPTMWQGFDEADILQPLVIGIADGLASDPTQLLSGPVMVEAVRRSLTATARRGATVLADAKANPAQIHMLLMLALDAAAAEIGKSIDGENLPDFLERVILGFLREPFALVTVGDAQFNALIGRVIEQLEAA